MSGRKSSGHRTRTPRGVTTANAPADDPPQQNPAGPLVPPAPGAPPPATQNATGQPSVSPSPAAVDALISLLASVREEIRSRRLLLFSNLVLAFTIPLGTLAVQKWSELRIPELKLSLWLFGWFIFSIPRPASFVFFFWLSGVISMLVGLCYLYQSPEGRAERDATFSSEEAKKSLVLGYIDHAVGQLNEAIEGEYRRLARIERAQKFFYGTLLAFLLSVTLEFLICLFSQ